MLEIKLWMRFLMKPVQINRRLSSRADSQKIHNYKKNRLEKEFSKKKKILGSNIKKLQQTRLKIKQKYSTVSDRPKNFSSIIVKKHPLYLVKLKRAIIFMRGISLEIIHIREGLMLRLKFQYFGHLMQKTNSLEKTLMVGKIESRRSRGRQRMRWLDGITNSME